MNASLIRGARKAAFRVGGVSAVFSGPQTKGPLHSLGLHSQLEGTVGHIPTVRVICEGFRLNKFAI